jgi:hypothetical protein
MARIIFIAYFTPIIQEKSVRPNHSHPKSMTPCSYKDKINTAGSRKLRKACLLFTTLVASASLAAQTPAVEPKKAVKTDNHFIAQFTFFSLECAQTDPFRIGLGLEGDYFLPKMSFHAAYNPSYFGVAKLDANILNTDNNKLTLFSFTEAGLRLNIWDRAASETFKWFEEKYRKGNYIYGTEHSSTYLARKIFGLRAGGFINRDLVNTDMNGANSPTSGQVHAQLRTDDGIIYGGGLPAYTDMHVAGGYAGLSFISIITEGKKRFRETYFDIQYAPLIRFDNIEQGGKNSKITPNASGSFLTHSIGWRLGYEVVVTKMPGFTCGFEVGDRPGIKKEGAYFGTRMSIAFCN